MGDVITVACDVCGEQKKKANRWWILWFNDGSAELKISEFDPEIWRLLKEGSVTRAVACGEEHAQQLAGRWMVTRSFDAPRRAQ